MVSKSAFHSTNSFLFLVTMFLPIARLHTNPHTTHNSYNRSDEGLTLETAAFKLFHGGQFTLSIQLIRLNDLVFLFNAKNCALSVATCSCRLPTFGFAIIIIFLLFIAYSVIKWLFYFLRPSSSKVIANSFWGVVVWHRYHQKWCVSTGIDYVL